MELSNEFEVAAPLDHAWTVLTDLERIAPCLPGAQLQEVEGDEYRGVVKVKVGPITAQYKGSAKFVSKDDDQHSAVLTASGRDTRGQGTASANITAELVAKGDVTHVSVLTDLTITGKVAQFGRGVIGDVSAKLLDQFVENLETTVLGAENDGGTSPEVGTAAAPAAAEPAAPRPGGAVGRETVDATTQMLASEITKIWNEDESAPGGPRGLPRETLPPRPDLLVSRTRGGDDASSAASEGSGSRRIEGAEPEPIDLLDAAGSPVLKRVLPAIGALALVALLVAVLLRRRRR